LKDLDPETRESGLFLDQHGRWHHEGTPVTHERLHRALTRWLERDPDTGRFRIRLGPDWWAWVEVEDAPFQAHLTGLTGEGLLIRLSSDRELVFSGPSLLIGANDAWYLPLGEPGLVARLSRGAMVALADHLVEDPQEPLGVALVLSSGRRVGFAT
jgi:hypothetical protein